MRSHALEWSYHGVDLSEHAAPYFDERRKARFSRLNAVEIDALDLATKPSVIMASNVFIYIEDSASLLRKLHAISDDRSYLIIVDIYKGGFWDASINYHNHKLHVWEHGLVKNGWKIEQMDTLSTFRYRDTPILPIAFSYLCRKQ